MDQIINDQSRFSTFVFEKGENCTLRSQFENRDEFRCQFIVLETDNYQLTLLNSILNILKDPTESNKDFLIFCSHNHEFNEYYSLDEFRGNIERAQMLQADVLVSGLSYFCCSIPIDHNLSWVESIGSAQFIVIFRRFYQTCLFSFAIPNEDIQGRISRLSQNKLVQVPFFSICDADSSLEHDNNVIAVSKISIAAEKNLKLANKMYQYYNQLQNLIQNSTLEFSDLEISIPTYIINLPTRKDRRSHIIKQFEGRSEFEINIIEAHHHSIGAIGLWVTIRKIIKLAIENDDDVVIICEDDHEFTDNYDRYELFRNIFEGFQQGIDYINGGTSTINVVVPVSKNRYWADSTRATQFMIIYKRLFEKILAYEFTKGVIADIVLSNLAENKMILYPFVSKQHNFGYSDVTPQHAADTDLVDIMFSETERRLAQIQWAFERYSV